MSTLDITVQSEVNTMNATSSDLKRKRSPSNDAPHPAPLPKAAKTHNHLQINYLARHCDKDLPLITNDDTLPNIISLLSDYQGVLDRHESMACNLGARPLGPILIKRFERLFDGPPRVLKSHGKDGTTVTWLDVVEFARNKPEQFQLGQMSEGVRVCQFYTKQCRVQISEEDFVLISSGIPQKMIPPQPIIEDEEKELGTLEILERNLGQICQLADQVAARTRQLNHRLKGRKQAILDRRATASPAPPIRASSPSNVALMNGTIPASSSTLVNLTQPSQSPAGGFVAVNVRPQGDQNGNNGASVTTRHELMSKFHTLSDRRGQSQPSGADSRRPSTGPQAPTHPSTPNTAAKPTIKPTSTTPSNQSNAISSANISESELAQMLLNSNSPVPIPGTPASLLPTTNARAAPPTEKDDGGPFKAEMVHRMEGLAKGERIIPPCDRCRRLHMDCLKNLTACMGCTKKHAKCSWKEVRESELRDNIVPTSGLSQGSDNELEEGFEAASTGSPPALLMSPQRPVLTPTGMTQVSEARLMPGRSSPTQQTTEKDRAVEEQLQKAAATSLAHARLEQQSQREREKERDVPRAEYQTVVAG